MPLPSAHSRRSLSVLLGAGMVLSQACSSCTEAPVDAPALPTPVAQEAAAWQGDLLDSASASQVLVLDRMPATWDLPELADGRDPLSRVTWTLTDLSRESADDTWYDAALPFHVPRGQRRFAPEGMVVRVDGVEAVFTVVRASAKRSEAPAWRFQKGGISVSNGGEPTTIEIVHPSLLQDYRRLDWLLASQDGMSADAYVHHGVSIKTDSREGLLLPAPTTATWSQVTLPEGATFDAMVTLAPTPVPRQSDGATVTLSLRTEAGTQELGRVELTGTLDGFVPFSLDLSEHAGTTGDLILATLPGANPDDDYVFVASPAITGTPSGPVRRVVVIGIDTLRPDHLGMYGYGRDTSPELDAWAQDAVVFDRAWTSAPRTRPSFRASTTGRRPLDAVCAKNIGEVFDEHGFATAGIVANIHLNPRFDFHKGFDFWTLDSGAKVTDQVERATAWLDDHQDRDSYLFLHIMDPHVFYVAPPPFGDRFTDTLPPLGPDQVLRPRLARAQIYAMMSRNQLDPLMRQHLEARYDGEIAYTSHHLAKLLAHLDTLPGETLVVIHSDHGEEFWDHGAYEHNHTLYDEVTKSVFVIKPPGGTGQKGARSDAMATLQDIAPTLYRFAGITDAPPTDGVDLVPALRGEPMDPERPIPIAHVQYEAQRWGVVWRDHKYVLWTGTGREELYHLVDDPGEEHDLSGTLDTSPWWQQVGVSHGVDVGPGWRVAVDVPEGQTLTLTLPADALFADVLDPEAVTNTPVNKVWGETPEVSADEVALVRLIDARTVSITGGSHGKGVVVVRFAHDVPPQGTSAQLGDVTTAVSKSPATVGEARLHIQPGVVLVPPPGESSLMARCLRGEGSDDELDLLKELGYVDMHDDGHDDEE